MMICPACAILLIPHSMALVRWRGLKSFPTALRSPPLTTHSDLGAPHVLRSGPLTPLTPPTPFLPTPPLRQPSDAVVSAPAETGKMACTLLKYAWAVGGGDFCLPDGVGIEFDVSSRDKAWHVLEIHYDNPNAMSTIRDTSGVHITLVKKKLIPAGFMWVGSSLGALSVPPGKKVHHVEVTCTYKQIPTAGVNAFAFINHAHLLGRKLYTTLTRGGKYIHDLGCDTAYDFDLQQILPFEKEVKLYKTDTLKASCVYDSTERTATTQGGDETENEMCINFIACKVAAPPTPPTPPRTPRP